MRKTIYSMLAAGACLQATAQVPKKVSTSLVHKVSATWCNPCGSWGWDLANELITATKGKALYMGAFPSNSIAWDTKNFYTETAVAFEKQLGGDGYPDFGNNMINHTKPNTTSSGINTAKVKSDVVSAVDAFALKVPMASPANAMKITGKTISVNARVTFWSAASGDYYLAAYMIEDKAKNPQNGQGSSTSPVAHHDVLRGSMSATAWGEMIATGSIAADTKYAKTFTFTVTDTKWDLANIKIYTVLWKKTGTTYEYVNASANEAATSVEEISGINSLDIYPNPASNAANLVLNVQEGMSFDLDMTDISGRRVYSRKGLPAVAGNNSFEVPVAQVPTGNYIIQVSAGGVSMVRQITVRR